MATLQDFSLLLFLMGKKSNKRTHPATLFPRSTGFHGGIKNSLNYL
jgi:hypothetical protein